MAGIMTPDNASSDGGETEANATTELNKMHWWQQEPGYICYRAFLRFSLMAAIKSNVKEHLLMFAVLKGVDRHCLESKVTEMVNEVGLADKVNSVVGTLSGGMKRKLSVGIALIGNSKVIILDEPTSGMDPYARRSTWQLIKKIKKEE
ncbi:hypothetical protein HPP92_018834 [Vanilla planifolia]|uniref:ABC transporter domain-containing protein n=1 Tax=Vanilla planifolia TaxID=51239 RepID=A0A835Q5P1_VANPL|nr:hypothetical protein HPP92_018834 [Vanilla planifolia]